MVTAALVALADEAAGATELTLAGAADETAAELLTALDVVTAELLAAEDFAAEEAAVLLAAAELVVVGLFELQPQPMPKKQKVRLSRATSASEAGRGAADERPARPR